MQVNMHEAKTQFSRLVERALAGEEVIIAKNGKPVATLTPLQSATSARLPGLSRGKGTIGDDFDASLNPEILREFE
jgi:prevent-host-death family protein